MLSFSDVKDEEENWAHGTWISSLTLSVINSMLLFWLSCLLNLLVTVEKNSSKIKTHDTIFYTTRKLKQNI